MNPEQSGSQPLDRGTVLAESRTDLAYDRTRLAADRTLLAWVRTTISLVGFGFTIYKFFQYLRESKNILGNMGTNRPRNLGLVLVALGTVLLIVAIVEYILYLRRLNRETGKKFAVSPTLFAALLVTIIGLFALFNLLFRLGPF